MKRNIKIVLPLLLILALSFALFACDSGSDPKPADPSKPITSTDVEKAINEVAASTDKSTIENSVTKLLGVSVSLPEGSAYKSEKYTEDGIDIYCVTISGSSLTETQCFTAVTRGLSGWTSDEANSLYKELDGNKALGITVEQFVDEETQESELMICVVYGTFDDDEEEKDLNTDVSKADLEAKLISFTGISGFTFGSYLGNESTVNSSVNNYYIAYLDVTIDEATFDAIRNDLTSKLTGFTADDRVSTEDGSFGGTTYIENTFSWTKTATAITLTYAESSNASMCDIFLTLVGSGVTPANTDWPTAAIDSFFGEGHGVPEYDGALSAISSLTANGKMTITVSGSNQTACDAYGAKLIAAGFVADATGNTYDKAISANTVHRVSLTHEFSSIDSLFIRLSTETVATGWPTAIVQDALGATAAAKLPAFPTATGRSFDYDTDGEEPYIEIYVKNVTESASTQLIADYGTSLISAGFVLYDESEYDTEYICGLSNGDYLEVCIYFDEYDSCIVIEATLNTYDNGGLTLPTNLKMKTASSYPTSGYKVGADMAVAFSNGSAKYWKYDSDAKLYRYYEFNSQHDWELSDILGKGDAEKNFVNAVVNNIQLSSSFTDSGETDTVLGVDCKLYTMKSAYMDYTAYVDAETGIILKYLDEDTVVVELSVYSEADVSFEGVPGFSDEGTTCVDDTGANHTYVNATCTVCGKVCAHKWALDATNRSTGVCEVCGHECPHDNWNSSGVCEECTALCKHNYSDGSGTCTICGVECLHIDFNTFSYTYDETYHCSMCGQECEHKYYSDGECTACGKPQ